jgi:hypothetical protein
MKEVDSVGLGLALVVGCSLSPWLSPNIFIAVRAVHFDFNTNTYTQHTEHKSYQTKKKREKKKKKQEIKLCLQTNNN